MTGACGPEGALEVTLGGGVPGCLETHLWSPDETLDGEGHLSAQSQDITGREAQDTTQFSFYPAFSLTVM